MKVYSIICSTDEPTIPTTEYSLYSEFGAAQNAFFEHLKSIDDRYMTLFFNERDESGVINMINSFEGTVDDIFQNEINFFHEPSLCKHDMT
jgi:hypothetical protein